MTRAALKSFRLWGLVPAWALMGLTLIIPVAIVAGVSLADRGPYGGFNWALNVSSYREILFTMGWTDELEFDPKYLVIIGRTLAYGLATTAICMALSVPVAYVIANARENWKPFLVYLVTLPFWVSMIVRVYAWLIILGNEGLAEKTWKFFGGGDVDTFLFTPGAMLTGMVYSYIPLMVLPVYAAIEKLDPALLEASHDLYGNRWTTLRRVILPLTWPGLAAGAILVFVPAIGTVLEPMLLGGGKQMMMGTLIQTQFGGGRNWPFGAAIAMVLMAMVVIVLVLNARRAAAIAREMEP
ncbi:ABC transporter permease [Poseidonocella sp. HB161398]|uniref:ABC transporter permease n=1 Tax=Poseidonocella sp. HB161398 TaxID=2320855 RepID=UPI0011098A4F|nr:ABC transporter permease [Poseidonocella sp. HB161398]